MDTLEHQLHTIAIVDDNQDVRDAIHALVRSCGHLALVFDSASALLASPLLEQCACIVSDVQMPDLSGLEMQQALRAAGCNTPVVFVTGFPDAKLRQRAFDGGASCFLGKPFNAAEMIHCIETALGLAKPARVS